MSDPLQAAAEELRDHCYECRDAGGTDSLARKVVVAYLKAQVAIDPPRFRNSALNLLGELEGGE